MSYLKDEQHYIDRYDRITVEICRDAEELFRDLDIDKYEHAREEMDEEGKKALKKMVSDVYLYSVKGNRFKEKSDTIRKWVEEDRRKDELIENTDPPQLVRCKKCSSEMEQTRKDLDHRDENRVLFFFQCPNNCLPHRLIYDDGEEWQREPYYCPECGKELSHSGHREGDTITTTYTCSHCSYTETDTLELGKHEEDSDPDFEKDRDRFIMSEEEGYHFIDSQARISEAAKYLEKIKEKEANQELYDKVSELKKLTIPQIKTRITEALKDEAYSNLVFQEPRMERIVTLPFTIEDPFTEDEYDSKKKLKNLLQQTLADTNWRIMSEGIDYRLGVLSGRIRVYEDEDELAKLIKRT